MKKNILMMFALLALMAFRAVAQEPKPKPDPLTPSVTPLRVQVVLAEYDGRRRFLAFPTPLP